MHSVSAGQIKAARALLDWSQEDLARKTRLSISTIRSLELGSAPRPSTAKEIRTTIENAGLEFIDGEGVRRRFEIQIYQGASSCDKFFEDMMQTVAQKGGEIVGYLKSQTMLLHSCGVFQRGDAYRLERLQKAATLKCVLAEAAAHSFALPAFQLRLLDERDSSPAYFYVYGNKHAMVLHRENGNFQFIVLSLMSHAQAYQKHFLTLWDRASQLPTQREKK